MHVTYDLFNEQPCDIDVHHDIETERAFLPVSHTVKDTLLLTDAGHFDLNHFEKVAQDSGYFWVRANKNINPIVTSAYCAGIEVKEKNIKLKALLDKFESQPVELTTRWKKSGSEYRLIYLPDAKRPVFLITSLKEAQFNFDELLYIYEVCWQIELFFK
ncbi:transposase [Pseudoalteromonas shioyasakiensis]|uniref:transposase n=1 Tax=Pseudoalteromonas shioyasakiensis TaxID=1190813 RepID=UPI0020957FE8|nr:transposase [Pseudoalteromonas shioyasakiensis]